MHCKTNTVDEVQKAISFIVVIRKNPGNFASRQHCNREAESKFHKTSRKKQYKLTVLESLTC